MSHHLRGLRGEEDVRHERLYWRTTTKSMAGSRRIFPIAPDLSAPCVVLDHLVRSTNGQGGLSSTRCRSMEDDWLDATVDAGLLLREGVVIELMESRNGLGPYQAWVEVA